MNALQDRPIICPPRWNLAIRTARDLPRPDRGRVYFIAFKRYFKVGSSHRVYERFREVISRHHYRKERFVSAVIGAQTTAYRKLEKQIHLLLIDRRFEEVGHEYYPRHQRIEAALMKWFALGSPDSISIIEAAEAASAGPVAYDSAVPCCWKCGAPQRLGV